MKLGGIIPATVTPMNSSFEVVEDDLRRYMQWITKFRIGGLAINVDTGEGPSLSGDERKRVLRTVAAVVKKKVPIIAGVPPASTAEAVRTAVEAKEAGADGYLVFPHPAFYGKPLSVDAPYHYHKAIADATRLPIVLFQLQPDLGGYELTEEVFLKLLEIPQVAAIKEAMFDAFKYNKMLRLVKGAPRKISMLTGNDNFIGESLVMGAEGALIGFGTLATDLQVDMFEKIERGLYKEALEIWEMIRPLEEVVFGPPVRDYRARTKMALAMQGVIENFHVRPPLLPLSRAEAEKVREALVKVEIPVERAVQIKPG